MTNGEGTAVLEKRYEMTGGVFILYLTPRKALEFLMTEENEFSINIDTGNISGKTTFVGNRENTLYYEFLRKINFNNYQAGILRDRLKQGDLSDDSTTMLKAMIQGYDEQEALIKKQFITKNKGTFSAHLVAAQMKPEISKKLNPVQRKWELKRRFFENVDFSDNKLSCSPVLFDLYEEYIQDFTFKNGDSLVAACDTILKKAAAGKENFKWSLYFLSSSFETSAVKGQDRVFVHLVEQYYEKGRCWWLTKEQLDNMSRRAGILKNLFVGVTCPDFIALDSSGKERSLHKNITGLTVLYFWAADCKHCLEETPKLAAWAKKHKEVKVITACASPDEDKWKEKLKEFKLPGLHFIDPEMKANYTYTYSITATPQMFVIDKNKKIVAKYIDDTAALDELLFPKKKSN